MNRRSMLINTAALTAVLCVARASSLGTDGSLNALFNQFMKENLDISPTLTTYLGLDTGARSKQKGEIDDCSLLGIEHQKALVASQLRRMRSVDRNVLSTQDAQSYDVIMYGLRTTDAANKSFHFGSTGAGQPYVISQKNGGYQQLPSFLDTQHTIATRYDAEAYIARLAAFAIQLDQELEVVKHDKAIGVVPPDFVLAKTLIQMQALRGMPADKSSLSTSIARRAQEKNIAGDYAQRATRIVREKIYPALDRQIALVSEMRNIASHDAGIWRLRDGDDYYAASLVNWCTTKRNPTDIHNLGLALVNDHTTQIDAVMKKNGMTSGSVGDRLRAMYRDPKYLYANTDASKETLLVDLNARVQRVRAKLPDYFGAVPKADVEIRRVPVENEAGAGASYNSPSLDGKRPGIYWINLRDTAEMPRWALPTLTYHESIPGHHLQLSIQQEANLPLIRKTSFYSAYGEGWALYAEQLAAEMGEYEGDPLSQIGQLQASMYRAVRLVLDTGLHMKRWSREQAVRYYCDVLGDPESRAITEVERYCVWPGQACAYMLGKLTILAQRARAREVLGTAFDIRKFHDAMLLPGAMPLELLERIYA